MKRLAIVSGLGILVTAAATVAIAYDHFENRRFALHADHLWSTDSAAYHSYRELGPIELRARASSVSRHSFGTEHIDQGYLGEALRILAGEKDSVLANRGAKSGRAAAREYLKQEFESFGFKVREEAYGTGVNLVAERSGRTGKFLVVSAHYDSVNNAGADDDGTGTVSMLATAKLLGNRELVNGVRFVAFDEEELGLVGSAAYVKNLVAQGEKGSILGNLQMEMMGYNKRGDGKFHVISCDRADSQFMADAFVSVIERLGNGLSLSTACTDRSDHASFWKKGIPAIVISENFFGGDSNPCYHRSCDKTDLVDFEYFGKVADASANVVLDLLLTERTSTPAPTETPAPSEPRSGSGSRWPS